MILVGEPFSGPIYIYTVPSEVVVTAVNCIGQRAMVILMTRQRYFALILIACVI